MKIQKVCFLLLLPIILFLPSLSNFFSSDDWFHLRVSNISSFSEFINFFSFARTDQSISFYRPLSTQVFFFIFQKLFGLNPLPYHLFVLLIFGFSLFLLYRLSNQFLKDKNKALLTTIVYGFSVSNFTRIYFLSAFQEIALVFFSLLCILNYLKPTTRHKLYSICFFALALLSKETAIVIPIILLVLDWSQKKINLNRLIPFALILLPYLYLRLSIFGFPGGGNYRWDFSPTRAANTLMWYSLWSVGSPEFLVDYIGSGLRPIARFYTDFKNLWPFILGLLLANLLALIYFLISNLNKIDRKFISFVLLFVISLIPVLFLPDHKFALELGLPLIWFSLAVTHLLPKKGKVAAGILLLYVLLNIFVNYLTYYRHYSVSRGVIASRVFNYFSKNFPSKPPNSYFEFINDTKVYSTEWGSSKQIANSIGESELFRVLYGDKNYSVYYEDLDSERPALQRIPISSKIFLQ